MANAVPDLWPDEVANVDMLTPLAILRIQAGQLQKKTKGLVEAEIDPEPDQEAEHYYFDIIAPALNRYRYRLLHVFHKRDQVYPVYVEDLTGRCATQEEFVRALSDIFSSSNTRSVISSIIAQSNEKRAQATQPKSDGLPPPAPYSQLENT